MKEAAATRKRQDVSIRLLNCFHPSFVIPTKSVEMCVCVYNCTLLICFLTFEISKRRHQAVSQVIRLEFVKERGS